MNNLILDIENFEEEKLSYIKPINFYKISRNIGIYYEKQKLIIKTPKMFVPFPIKKFNNKIITYQLSLSFSALTDLYNDEEIKKFYSFIKNIDKINEEIILRYKKKWKLPKNLIYKKTIKQLNENYPNFMNLYLPQDNENNFLFNIYDEKANKSSIDIIKKSSIVSLILELTDLKFTDTYFRTNWKVLQIRKFHPYSPIQEFFMSGCFISDDDDPKDNVYLNILDSYKKKIEIPVITNLEPNIPLPPPLNNIEPLKKEIIKFQPPSLTELLDAKKLLKSTKKKKKIDNKKN